MDEAEKKLRAELTSVVVTADQIHAHNKAVATERERRKKLRDASSAATHDGQPASGDHHLDEFQKHNAKRLDSLLARTLLQHSTPAEDDAKPSRDAQPSHLRLFSTSVTVHLHEQACADADTERRRSKAERRQRKEEKRAKREQRVEKKARDTPDQGAREAKKARKAEKARRQAAGQHDVVVRCKLKS